MARSGKKARRLFVGEATFLWSTAHEHEVAPSGFGDCREVLTIRRYGSPGRLIVEFAASDGRFVSDGCAPSGIVSTVDGRKLNLHEPGTVRALLDECEADGWDPISPQTKRIDGWSRFDAISLRRSGPSERPGE